MGSWGTWRRKANAATEWPPCSNLDVRVASDCSGLGTPELALKAYGAVYGVKCKSVFCCDVLPASRRFLQQNLDADVLLADMTERLHQPGSISALDLDGRRVLVPRQADIDLYVAGTMCTPFSPKGAQKGFQDENAKTLVEFLRTLVTLRPRSAVLENVVLQAKFKDKFAELLSIVSGYTIRTFVFAAFDYGLPQSRIRQYTVFLRKDALRAAPAVTWGFFKAAMVSARISRDDLMAFPVFLAHAGESLPESGTQQTDTPADEECRCNPKVTCNLHACHCPQCRRAGRQTLRCKWRSHAVKFEACVTSRKARLTYLKQWRLAKRNHKLKSVPDFFILARLRGLDFSIITSPRERCMLRSVAKQQNLLHQNAVIDLSQGIQRKVVRRDGLVPTLGTGCSRIMVPSTGSFLNWRQCSWLQGINITELNLENVTADEMHHMAGNAMCLPVVGTVIVAALSLLEWPSNNQ